ncbi:RNA polymerase sigma factor SigY [Mesobacillus foraminis]|uniref:RNA polymerase sigma factor SigY n=1 Tax=Mesobacillus foraminis TaxID=279826 RepID=UPI001BEA2756|nr:RNA polymerase sigma factor SigY [Mesobacillus foraminis]MBT2759445.1 RNA polymerase sigma factor SigY [Mesobacillus foraminis]
MEEKELVKKAKQGDHSAFSMLFRENYPLLVKYLLKVTMNPDAAEELAQETMAKSLEKIHLFNGKSKFSTWLISISTNLFIDQHRKRKREKAWREQETDGRKLKWHMDSRREEWSDALSALSRLSSEMRAAIILKHYYGYSYDEIGEMLRVSPGTVKSRVHNGLTAVRKELDHDGKEPKKGVN